MSDRASISEVAFGWKSPNGAAALERGAPAPTSRTVAGLILVAVGYFLGAKLGFALTFEHHAVSVLWPPNSIVLAAMILTPPRKWWLVALAVLPAHWLPQIQSQIPPAMILCWYISNCLEALIGAGFIYWLTDFPLRFDRLRNFAVFAVGGVFLGPFLSSFVDAGFVRWNQMSDQDFWVIWRMRLTSNTLTALTFVPFLVMAFQTTRETLRAIPRARIIEGVGVAVALVTVSGFAFLGTNSESPLVPILLYSPLPFMLWATLRFGPAGASASILAVSLIAIWGAAHGKGPFQGKSPQESAFSIQLFFTAVAVNLLTLGVILKERKKADQDLRLAQERYRDVMESHTDPVCRYLPDLTLTFVNEAYCKLVNKTREACIGGSLLDFVRADEREDLINTVEELTRSSTTTIRERESFMRGGPAWHQWTSFCIFDSEGRVRELQAVGHDITDRKRAEDARQSLAHASRLAVVGELTAMIAHEVNQPLGAILSNADAAEMILENDNPPINQLREILADIRKDDLRASESIHRLRALLQKREVDLKPIDLNETIRDVIHLVSGDAQRRRTRINVELEPALPQIMGDKVHLQQVLLNLVVNGMDAMAETTASQRQLIIRTRRSSNNHLEVSVQDHGHGIAPEALPRIFESFFTTKKEGMGLGLYIARSIIEAHNGHINSENNAGGGAIFRVLLPTVRKR